MNTQNDTSSNISRRELLKRGAIVGGVTIWVTPIVQAVGMGAAYAQDVSPGCTRLCMMWVASRNEETSDTTCAAGGAHPIWTNTWRKFSPGTGLRPPSILTCPDDAVNNTNAAQELAERPGREFVVYGSPMTGLYVAFPNDVKVANLEDESEPWSAAARCGAAGDKYTLTQLAVENDPCFSDANGPYLRVRIDDCDGGAIEEIELIVDFCPGASG